MVVVIVDTLADVVDAPLPVAEAAMVVLQSVHVPVQLVHGAPLGAPLPHGSLPLEPQPLVLHVDHEHGPHPLDPPGPRYPLPGPPHGPLPLQPDGAPGRAVDMAENHGLPPHDDHDVGHAEPPDVAENVASGDAVTVWPALAQFCAIAA